MRTINPPIISLFFLAAACGGKQTDLEATQSYVLAAH